MKGVKKFFLLAMAATMAFSFCACSSGGSSGDVNIDDDGNVTGTSNVLFWGWGEEYEIAIFNDLIDQFEDMYPNIDVEFVTKPSGDYNSALITGLSGRSGPDVFYCNERQLKSYVAQNLLEPLDSYLEKSTAVKEEEMWDGALTRYRVDSATWASTDTAPLYALPKAVSPTVIYYNKAALDAVNVDVISAHHTPDGEEVAPAYAGEKDLEDYNTEHNTDYPAKGFFLLDASGNEIPITLGKGTNAVKDAVAVAKSAAKRIFNNRIPMTWDESVVLAGLMTKSYNTSSITDYGYFTEWWFSYGWSVGGDCLEWNESENCWKFTLGDKEKKWLYNGEFYREAKLPAGAKENGAVQMTNSQFDAFRHFVQLSMSNLKDVDGEGNYGYQVTPGPTTVGSDDAKASYFASGKLAMLVDARFATVTIGNKVGDDFEWDVAPLPKSPDGIEAGHSNSTGIAIRAKSKVKNAAWLLAEFIAGRVGQEAQSKTGFCIPNQIDLAYKEGVFLGDQGPENSRVFINAAYYQKPGDWMYLADQAWISPWSNLLNGDVRNGKVNVTEFFDRVQDSTDDLLKGYSKQTN